MDSWVEPVMCLAQGPQRSDASEARTRGPSVWSQALYHWATALPIFPIWKALGTLSKIAKKSLHLLMTFQALQSVWTQIFQRQLSIIDFTLNYPPIRNNLTSASLLSILIETDYLNYLPIRNNLTSASLLSMLIETDYIISRKSHQFSSGPVWIPFCLELPVYIRKHKTFSTFTFCLKMLGLFVLYPAQPGLPISPGCV